MTASPAPITVLWVRILSNLASGFGFVLIGIITGTFATKRFIGHRVLLYFTTIFCGERALSNLVTAWDLAHNGVKLAMWAHIVTGVVGVLFSLMVLASRDDLLRTLQTTEEAEERRRDIIRDVEQMQLLSSYLSETTRDRSKMLRAEQERILCPQPPSLNG